MKKFNVKVNGKSYEVEVEAVDENNLDTGGQVSEKPASPAISSTPAPASIPTTEPAKSSNESVSNQSSSQDLDGEEVLAPLPGTITVKASEGDNVSEGDVIFILEAMKMENEITAPASGTLKGIQVSTGDNVDTDDVLAVIV